MNSQLDQVLECFSRMDVEGLRLLLKNEQYYYDVPKEAFFLRLEESFDDFKNDYIPTDHLVFFPGACCSKSCDLHLGRTAFRFLGSMGNFFDLRFILEKDENGIEYIKDIYPCYHLVTNEKVKHLRSNNPFWVYEDDKITNTLRPNHQFLVSQSEQAYNAWLACLKDQRVSLADIKAWLIKNETTYLEIGGFRNDLHVYWRWDKFLEVYHDLDKFKRFISEFSSDFQQFEEIQNSPLSDSKLLTWIIDCEKRLDSQYSQLYGSIFMINHKNDHWEVSIKLNTTILLNDEVVGTAGNFLSWFEKEREKLLIKFFSFTLSEMQEFEQKTKSPYDLYQVRSSLSYHLEIREKFRKQGIFIPFGLGKQIYTNLNKT